MGGLLALLILIMVLAALGGYIMYKSRSLLREAKNYERGLKMVPLLIHLPPSSDDIEAKGRDARDIADENISKASVLYSILSSTVAKGFKSKLYGQKHISLELVAHKGRVQFYTAVPVTLIPVIEQAVLSAYPNGRLEEVPEHNIFNPVGKISGTIGGELVLKKSYVNPIATYVDLKRDTMQALLNSLSKLEKDDGVGIQILIRPAQEGWAKKSKDDASKLRDGKKKKEGADLVFWWIKQIFIAPVKPPETKEDGKIPEDDKPVSGLDQSLAEAIEEKAKHPGFEVLIRVIASSNISHRSQTILSNITASFALFDAPGKNGFKFVPARDIESFVTSYILRFFPAEQKSNILNAVELATIYHLPDSSTTPTTQLERQQSKQVDGPRNIMENGLLLGYNVFRGVKKPIRLSENDRRRHMYVIGQTGTGKSTFLENIALQDMLEGRGFAFVDPHGDVSERLLGMVPKERTEDVIYFCPAEMDYPLGFNLFEFHNPEQKDFIIQEVINMIYKLYDPQRQGIVGPRFEHIFRNCALLLMADPSGGTFIDVPKLLIDPDFVRQKLKYTNDRTVIDFWTKEFPNSQRSNDAGEMIAWVVSKFSAFMSNEMMRNIIGQTKSSFNMRDIMDEGKILLVNLSKGRTGELNSKLLGMIFVMKFQAAAMSRADVSEEQRRDFCLYVDEFQNFATDSFESILSEARKFRLNLIVANQFITQLEEGVRDAIFGNIGAVVAHRVGTNDAEQLEKYFRPVFDVDDLQQLPNYNAIVKMLIGGVPTQPFSMMDLPYLGTSNQNLADALKQLSAAKHGRPRAVVEKEIFDRLTVIPQSRPSFGNNFGSPRPGAMPPSFGPAASGSAIGQGGPAKPAGQSSFLDEWLAKRKKTGVPVAQASGQSNAVPSSSAVAVDKNISSNPEAAASDNRDNTSSDSNKVRPTQSFTKASDRQKNVDEIDSLAPTGDILDEYNSSEKLVNQEKSEPAQKDHDEAENIAKTGDNGSFNHDDTIIIDRDGNLKIKE